MKGIINVRVEDELRHYLDETAKRKHTTVSSVIREILWKWAEMREV